MIVNKNIEITEEGGKVYICPVVKAGQQQSWYLYITESGEAQLYTKFGKCYEDGIFNLLGKPIKLNRPSCAHDFELIPVGDPRNRFKSDNYICRICTREYRKTK